MKRYLLIAGVVLLVAGTGSYLAFGGQQGNDPMGGGMMGGGMMNRGGPQQGMMQNNRGMMPMMRGMMAQGMMQSMSQEALVATSDGGVVVLAGGKLIKYDSSLNLVKEVELKVDYENMQQRMQKMMENMPMMRGSMVDGGMMRGGMMGGGQTRAARQTWEAPASAAARRNPVPFNRQSVAAGRALFDRNCASCHGMNGKGNGVAADLTATDVQDQTDGALFWKIAQGKPPMPSFENVLTARQAWQIIDYIRTLAFTPGATSTSQP